MRKYPIWITLDSKKVIKVTIVAMHIRDAMTQAANMYPKAVRIQNAGQKIGRK